MAFPANSIASGANASNPAKDAIPVSASSANNVFGAPYNSTNKTGDNRCCRSIYCDATTTISFVAATGVSRATLILPQGIFPCQIIQITSITGGNVWALI